MPEPKPALAPHVVRPRAFYLAADLTQLTGLTARTLRREHRLGRLRLGKRAGRVYALGSWVLQWLEAGEMVRRPGGAPA